MWGFKAEIEYIHGKNTAIEGAVRTQISNAQTHTVLPRKFWLSNDIRIYFLSFWVIQALGIYFS